MGLGDERVQDRRLAFQDFRPKGLDMKTNRRFTVCQRFLVRVALADHDTLQAERVRDKTVGVFLNYDLPGLHAAKLTCRQTG